MNISESFKYMYWYRFWYPRLINLIGLVPTTLRIFYILIPEFSQHPPSIISTSFIPTLDQNWQLHPSRSQYQFNLPPFHSAPTPLIQTPNPAPPARPPRFSSPPSLPKATGFNSTTSSLQPAKSKSWQPHLTSPCLSPQPQLVQNAASHLPGLSGCSNKS